MPRLRSIVLAAILFALASASTAGLAQGQARKSYNAAIGDSSISGISSGAFMAVQFGFAWSSIIKGVEVGGPFYCAQASAAAMRRIDWAVELMSEKAREQPAFPHRSVPIHRTVQKSTLVNFTSSGMVMLR
jgi:hypothetical protein